MIRQISTQESKEVIELFHRTYMANHNQFWCDRAHFEYTLETLRKNKLGFDYTQIKEAIDAKWDTNGQIWLRNKAN